MAGQRKLEHWLHDGQLKDPLTGWCYYVIAFATFVYMYRYCQERRSIERVSRRSAILVAAAVKH